MHTWEFYVWIVRREQRAKIMKLIAEEGGNLQVRHLTGRRAVDAFVAGLGTLLRQQK